MSTTRLAGRRPVPIQATGTPWRRASDLRGNVFTREPARHAVIGQATRPADATAFSGSGLFAAPVRRTFTRRATYSAEGVMGVESTRATSLSWPQDVRAGFNAELRQLLGGREVPLTLEAPVTMARVRG
jgi:hypothetical protein